jgi:hypothetical protein
MEPSIPPPSPLPPTEPGPSLQTLDRSTQLLDTDSPNVPKQDLEREILIECSEVYAQSLAKDWESVAALGMAMDLKVRSVSCACCGSGLMASSASSFCVSAQRGTYPSACSIPLRILYRPAHPRKRVSPFCLPRLVTEVRYLVFGYSRGTLMRLIALESIVSQHPVFQSLNAYAITSCTCTECY